MDAATIGVVCSIVFGALGFLVAYLTFNHNKKKATEEEGENRGVIASDIGYIKAGVDDLKRESRETRTDVVKLGERVTRCEESCKQAHHRIDEIKSEKEN